MVFSSIPFLFIYLVVVLAVYYAVPIKWRNLWLFGVNLLFYGWGERVYILLMIFSVTVNYINGILIDKHRANEKKAKRILLINTIINLGLLVFFKYFDLIIETISIIPIFSGLEPLGLVLPIGISFYTFQTMSYPIDVYRGDASVQKNYVSFGTFVALFPQLIAGPIVRYKDVADQLNFRSNSVEQFASGIRRFTVGLAKKTLIANNIGSLWDMYSALAYTELTTFGAWFGILAFAFQIYFDFSGYSDMAIGLGRMLGFEFLENFNYPYISKSITEFWRRWHMSLGTWFRDYVYIPLGGNRCGFKRQILNICVVWALTGIWHGASWNFLLWGVYYAIFLVLEKLFLLKKLQAIPRFFSHFYTIFVVIIGWVLFELTTVEQCVSYIKAMFGLGQGGLIASEDYYYLGAYFLTFVIAAIASTPLGATIFKKIPEKTQGILAPILLVFALILSTAYIVDGTYNPFLYFRF